MLRGSAEVLHLQVRIQLVVMPFEKVLLVVRGYVRLFEDGIQEFGGTEMKEKRKDGE